MDYKPRVYAATYAACRGRQLWDFLNSHDNLLRMETATALERPAVEGIEDQLLEEFGAVILEDRVKQMVGHMVRQILERHGYVISAQNVKITNGAPFSRATRYTRGDDMTYHVWRRTSDARSLALTSDKSGDQLPGEKTDWVYWKSFRGALRGLVAFDLKDKDAAHAEIAGKGYYTYKMERLMRAPTH